MSDHLSSLAKEASVAKTGLLLLARACGPLLERCRSLAMQKRFMLRWYGGVSPRSGRGSAPAAYCGPLKEGSGLYRGSSSPIIDANNDADVSWPLVVDGLRGLVTALGRGGGGGGGQGSRCLDRENSPFSMSSPGFAAVSVGFGLEREVGDGRGGGGAGGDGSQRGLGRPETGVDMVGSGRVGVLGRDEAAATSVAAAASVAEARRGGGKGGREENGSGRGREGPSSKCVVSLRAVGIALVAAQRLWRLGRLRAIARATKGKADATVAFAKQCAVVGGGGDGNNGVGDGRIGNNTLPAVDTNDGGRWTQWPLRQHPTALSDLIPLFPWDTGGGGGSIGSGAWGNSGGVVMLSEADVRSLSPMALTEGPVFAFLTAAAAEAEAAASAVPAVVPTGVTTATDLSGTPFSVIGGSVSSSGSAARCLRLLDALLVPDDGDSGGSGRQRPGREGDGAGVARDSPTLLQALADGQAGHWRRIEERGLVPLLGPVATTGSGGRVNGRFGVSRIAVGRFIRCDVIQTKECD